MEKGKTIKQSKKIFSVIKITLLILFTALAATVISFTIKAKANGDDAVSIFNHQMRIVLTNSMGKDDATDVSNFEIKSIPVNSMVFIKEVPEDKEKANEFYADIKVGDVLTFKYRYVTQVVITHRVIDIEEKVVGDNKGYIFTLMGDNKSSSDNPGVQMIDTTEENSFNYIIGKVTGVSVFLGFMFSKTGLCILIIVPSSIVLIYEIVKIIRIFALNKEEKNEISINLIKQEKEEKDKELERLRKEIEELKTKEKEDKK